jgi:hypothetical protein
VLALLEQRAAAARGPWSSRRSLLGDRRGVVEAGRQRSSGCGREALAERAGLVEATSVHREAPPGGAAAGPRARAGRGDAAEVEDYVDSKLANFEVVLSKTLAAVEKGRRG